MTTTVAFVEPSELMQVASVVKRLKDCKSKDCVIFLKTETSENGKVISMGIGINDCLLYTSDAADE